MRFRHDQIAPSGKRQYWIALGRVDIELLLGEATNALAHTPDVAALHEVRGRRRGIKRGLSDALAVAKANGDEGDRLPWVERKPQRGSN